MRTPVPMAGADAAQCSGACFALLSVPDRRPRATDAPRISDIPSRRRASASCSALRRAPARGERRVVRDEHVEQGRGVRVRALARAAHWATSAARRSRARARARSRTARSRWRRRAPSLPTRRPTGRRARRRRRGPPASSACTVHERGARRRWRRARRRFVVGVLRGSGGRGVRLVGVALDGRRARRRARRELPRPGERALRGADRRGDVLGLVGRFDVLDRLLGREEQLSEERRRCFASSCAVLGVPRFSLVSAVGLAPFRSSSIVIERAAVAVVVARARRRKWSGVRPSLLAARRPRPPRAACARPARSTAPSAQQ